jgi:uncharacterized protein (TIGR03437 family)
MVLFRRFILAAAVLAMFASLAGAQVIAGGGGSSGGTMTCAVVNTGNPTQVRSGGHSELLGEIVIQCQGGSPLNGVQLANITVALSNTIVTSRVFPNGVSEALLLIDEPGAGPFVGPGGDLPQTVCSGGVLGAGPGGCVTQAGTVGGYVGAVLASNTSVVPNVFQGVVVSGNQVVFNGIPILAPVTAGLARVFRITNIRTTGSAFAPPHIGVTPVLASVSISGGVQLQNPVPTLGFLFDGLGATSVRNASNSAAGTSINIQQCAANALTPGAVLSFREGFAAAFKTRIAPTATLSGAATPPNSTVTAGVFTQNTPGQVLPGSESGFIVPVTGGTAGLADFGTRLKATFNNVPAGVSIYVSTTNINPAGNANVNPLTAPNLGTLADAVAAGNFGASEVAALVASETAPHTTGAALPLVSPTITSNGVPLFGPLPVDANGTATAVWELLGSNPNANGFADFAVFYSSAANTPPLTPPGTVSLSLAPTFSSATDSTLIPRMTPPTTATNLITVTACPVISLAPTAPTVFGQPVTFTATAPGASGTVTFTDGATTLGIVAIASGQASFTTNALAAGVHTIGASLGAATATIAHTVNKATTTTTLAVPAAVNAGQSATLTATVTPAFGGAPTGTVTFREGATVLGATFLNAGIATITTSLPIGGHPITATYNGDANFITSPSTTQTVSVNPRATSVSTPVITSGTPAPGQPLTFSATVSGDGPLTGMLTFRDNGSPIGDGGLSSAGTATVTATLGAGQHSITASYSGDTFNRGATSAPLFFTIRINSTTTLVSSLNPATPGTALSFTATVASSSGAATPAGAVTFTDGAATLGTATMDATGQAILTVAAGLTAGDHSIVATYAGDTNLLGSTSAPLIQRVTQPATTTTLSEGVTAAGFYLTAAVQSASSGSPTGSAQFRDLTANSTLGTATLANGVATIAVPAPLPIGHTVQAVYDGDATFAGSTSAPQVFIAAANGFSFGLTFVPDSVASIFGAGLAPTTATAPGVPLPTELGGIHVRLVDSAGGQHTALLYYVSPGQINLVIPADTPFGPARLMVVTPDGALTLSITIGRTGPALTSADGTGSGTAAAQFIRLHRDGTQDAPVPVSPAPIPIGTDRLFMILYGTGLRHAARPATCSLNGQTVTPLFAGAHSVYPGLDQINLEVPPGLRGLISVSCSADGAVSNAVTINVQ